MLTNFLKTQQKGLYTLKTLHFRNSSWTEKYPSCNRLALFEKWLVFFLPFLLKEKEENKVVFIPPVKWPKQFSFSFAL